MFREYWLLQEEIERMLKTITGGETEIMAVDEYSTHDNSRFPSDK